MIEHTFSRAVDAREEIFVAASRDAKVATIFQGLMAISVSPAFLEVLDEAICTSQRLAVPVALMLPLTNLAMPVLAMGNFSLAEALGLRVALADAFAFQAQASQIEREAAHA